MGKSKTLQPEDSIILLVSDYQFFNDTLLTEISADSILVLSMV